MPPAFEHPKSHRMDRFLETSLLVILSRHPGYGYDLLADLEDFGFVPGELNVGTLYRVLRKLAKQNMVEATWQPSDRGPNRRVYHITTKGRYYLHQRIDTIQARLRAIELLLAQYQSITTKGDKNQ